MIQCSGPNWSTEQSCTAYGLFIDKKEIENTTPKT